MCVCYQTAASNVIKIFAICMYLYTNTLNDKCIDENPVYLISTETYLDNENINVYFTKYICLIRFRATIELEY